MNLLRPTLLTLACLLALPATASDLPSLGDASSALVSPQQEHQLGRAWLGLLRGQVSQLSDPQLKDFVESSVYRLSETSQLQDRRLEFVLLDSPQINAFAAPGGQVVLVRGLLDKAEHPDEVAGVLAHELAHVENRDTTREALRAAGSAGLLTMILGDFTGGAAIAIVGEHMISASYTRDAEGKADDFALDMLANAGVSAEGFAGFFDRIAELEGFALPAYLSSHPVTEERAMQARDFAGEQADTTPILTDAEWSDLQGICDSVDDHNGD